MAASNLASRVRFKRQAASTPRPIQQADTVLLCLGLTERGPVDTLTECSDFDDFQTTFGGYTANNLLTMEALKAWNQRFFFVRTVHHTTTGDPSTKTSAAATLDIDSASSSPTAGTVLGTTVGPFALAHGDTIIVNVDAGGNTTATISATAASRTSTTGTYSLSNNQTLVISIDGGTSYTKTFTSGEFVSISAATPAEVVASLNAFFAANGMGAVASVVANAVKITSNRKGTGSGVNVVSGTANSALSFTTGNTAGTGNVSNVLGVTVAEIKTIVEAAVSGCTVTNVGGAVQIASNTTGGSSSIQVISTSTADDEIGLDNALHGGSAGTPVTTMTLDAEDGDYGNAVTAIVATASNGDTSYFDFKLAKGGVVANANVFVNVTMDDTDPRYLPTVVNGNNTLGITITDAGVGLNPAAGTYGPLTGGDDGLTSLADSDFSGGSTANGKTGIMLFDGTDEGQILICPQRSTAAVAAAINTYVDVTREQRIFAIHDPPAGQSTDQIVTYVTSTAALLESVETAAIYYPRVKVASPDETLFGTDLVTISPSGHIAAAYARGDAVKIGGAFASPGGTDITLPGVLALENDKVKDYTERSKLTAARINPISQERGTNIFVDGVYTLLSTGPCPFVGQSRGTISVVHSLADGLRFLRQKNITDDRLKAASDLCTGYMRLIADSGELATRDYAQAFQVDFSPALNPPSQRAKLAWKGRIGIAYAQPGIFVDVDIYPDTRAAQAELAAA